MLTRQILSECVHCVGFRWPKTTIFGKFWLLGARVPTPFYRWGLNVVCYSRHTVYEYVPNDVIMSDADCTPGREPHSVAASQTGCRLTSCCLTSLILGKGAPIVKYRDFLPWAVQKRPNWSICRLGCGLRWAEGIRSSVVFARWRQCAQVQSFSL